MLTRARGRVHGHGCRISDHYFISLRIILELSFTNLIYLLSNKHFIWVLLLKKPGGRNLKAVALLSIVIPISLLISFRLTGILQGSTKISETITLETIKWEFERPNQTVTLNETLGSPYSSSEISTTMTVRIWKYDFDGFFSDDLVPIIISANLTTIMPNSFVKGVYVILQTDYQSPVRWLHTDFRFENLSLIDVEDWGWQDIKAYVGSKGVNRPEDAYFSGRPLYSLKTPNTQTHQLDVFFELTYYNGTTYKKVVQPFQLKFLGNNENG